MASLRGIFIIVSRGAFKLIEVNTSEQIALTVIKHSPGFVNII